MKIALVIPAYNEELTIREVITEFYRHNADLEIYVVDNNSSDHTSSIALETYKELQCKGKLLFEPSPGKSAAVRKAFTEVDADIYVMVDADCTYPASDLDKLLQPIKDGEADMVVGDRHSEGHYKGENKRPFHNFGNNLVRDTINFFFKSELKDILSGYRVFTKSFVKNYPIMCSGFELETELTLHTVDKRFRIVEVPVAYLDRPEGSVSKLNTYFDGLRVIKTIFNIFRHYRPIAFFSAVALLFFFMGLVSGLLPIVEYIQTQYVSRVPLAILASGLMIISLLTFSIGLILDGIVTNHRFMYELKLIEWKSGK